MKASVPIQAAVGMTNQQFNSNIEDYSALVSTNPTRVPILSFAIASSATGGTSQTAIAYIKLIYHATLWDRVQIASS